MTFFQHTITVIAVICFALLMGIFKWKFFDNATKILVLIVGLALITEVIAAFSAYTIKNNMLVYNIYSMIELSVLILYFNSLKIFKRKSGYILIVVTLLLGLVNFTLLQPITVLNSFFLLYEGFVIIAMSLYSFCKILLENDELSLRKYPHFWFVTFLLFFWSLTYMNCGLYDVLVTEAKEYLWVPHLAVFIANIVMYCGIGTTFIFYKRMKAVDG